MPYVHIQIIGDPKRFTVLVKKKVVKIKQNVLELGKITAAVMKINIAGGIKRPPATGNLAKSIRCHVFPGMVGVGLISELPVYWYVVNYGKYFSGADFIPGGGKGTVGYFGDGNPPDSRFSGKGTEKWTRSIMSPSGFGFYMNPKNPIRPMNYIEKTVSWLKPVWKDYVKK